MKPKAILIMQTCIGFCVTQENCSSKRANKRKAAEKQLAALGTAPAKSALNSCLQLPQNLISSVAHCIWLILLHPRTAASFSVDKKKDIVKVTSTHSTSSRPRNKMCSFSCRCNDGYLAQWWDKWTNTQKLKSGSQFCSCLNKTTWWSILFWPSALLSIIDLDLQSFSRYYVDENFLC